MNIAGVGIGDGHPCRTVAEISNNHNGRLDLAMQLIEEAAIAGADFIKFQCYTARELVTLRGDGPAPEPWGSQGWTMAKLYEKAQTPHSWFSGLAYYCGQIGIPWFSSAFGTKSLAVLLSADCPAVKFASIDLDNPLATGLRYDARDMAFPVIVQSAPELVRPPTIDADLVLWCPPGYPQSSLSGMRQAMETYDGLSYHGTDPMAPVKAAKYGAHLVECHVQLSNPLSDLESEVSLTTGQFGDMVTAIRERESGQ